MDRCGERRRICEVRVLKIIQLRVHIDSHNRDVHHLVYRTRSKHLHAEKFSRCPVRDDFGNEEGGIRVVVRLVICRNKRGDHIISRFFCLFFRKTGAPDVQPRQFYHTGSKHARIGFLRPGNHLRQSASLQVCRRSHGRPLSLPGDPVRHHHAVAGSIYVGKAGLHLSVNKDRSLEHLNARILKECCIRTDSRSHDKHLAGEGAC